MKAKASVPNNTAPSPTPVVSSNKPGFFKRLQGNLQRLSGAFLFPLAVLPLAGLLLGLGGGLSTLVHDHSSFGYNVLQMLSNIGNVVFANLPILFGISIAITFANDVGTVGVATVFMFLTFFATQTSFLHPVWEPNKAGITCKEADNYDGCSIDHYTLFFNKDVSNNVVTNMFSMPVINSSIFGGIVIGMTTAWLHRHLINVKVPSMLAFFSGARLVAIAAFVVGIIWAYVFAIVWPYIGNGLQAFGIWTGTLPYGIDSLIFGFTERALLPFGLHHAFYGPLWWTSAGGSLFGPHVAGQSVDWATGDNSQLYYAYQQYYQNVLHKSFTLADFLPIWNQWISNAKGPSSGNGDQTMLNYVISLPFNTAPGTNGVPLFDFLDKYASLQIGKYMSGKFFFMLFGLTAAGGAMIMAADKEHKKLALSLIGASIVTVALTGITEPIEFTFLFLAPALFWGFHAVMAGVAFMLGNLLDMHTGVAVSGGIVDWIIFGLIPLAKGTNPFWIWAFGPLFSVVYFFVFYFVIKKWNLPTPGRGTATKLFSKADYKAKVAVKSGGTAVITSAGAVKSDVKYSADQEDVIVEGLGGLENLTTVANCASRLRIVVKDPTKVNKDILKSTGSFGVIISGQNVQVIYGPRVSQVRESIRKAFKI